MLYFCFDFMISLVDLYIILQNMSGERALSRKTSAQNLKEKIVKYYEAIFQVNL